MSSPYIMPFNNMPANTGAGSTTYTVPAGKYARVTISIEAAFNIELTSQQITYPTISCQSQIFTVWMRAGDVLSGSLTGATAGTVSANSHFSRSSGANALINSSVIGTTVAIFNGYNTGGSTATVSVTNRNNFFYWYEEFNVIS